VFVMGAIEGDIGKGTFVNSKEGLEGKRSGI
jgi:hypothetical protein